MRENIAETPAERHVKGRRLCVKGREKERERELMAEKETMLTDFKKTPPFIHTQINFW